MFMATILMLLALLHGYWAIGGRWPARDARALAELVVGTRQMASAGACCAVAVALLIAAVLVLGASGTLALPLPSWAVVLGAWTAVVTLALRGIGGFFEARFRPEARELPYHWWNLRLYSPLCLAVAALGALELGAAAPEAKLEQATSAGVPSAVPGGVGALVPFTVYFPSREYVETGKDSVDRLLPETITLEPALAAAGNDRRATALLEALARGPTSAAAVPAIPARIQIRSVHVRGGVAELDLARAGLNGGSLEEQLLVDSIVRTLTRLPKLHAVRFLVEGKQIETLMGHVSTAQPISAPD